MGTAGSAAPLRMRTRGGAGRLAGLGALVVAAAALLSGCSIGQTFHGFGWPQGGVTEQSHRMYNLWIGSVTAALTVGVLVWGLIFWCVVRYRKRGEHLPPQTRYNLPIELIYSVAPFLVVSVLFYYTAIVQTDVTKVRPDPDVTVEVVAFKWSWKFVYPDQKDPAGQPVATIGDPGQVPVLVVPTHRRIRFVEHSQDVIHSFWVPELLFKRDAFPGNVINTFEVTIEEEGSYVGRCAELCGTYHFTMTFELRAVTPDQYQRFLAGRATGMSTPQALQAIGQEPYATTTKPLPTNRTPPTAR